MAGNNMKIYREKRQGIVLQSESLHLTRRCSVVIAAVSHTLHNITEQRRGRCTIYTSSLKDDLESTRPRSTTVHCYMQSIYYFC